MLALGHGSNCAERAELRRNEEKKGIAGRYRYGLGGLHQPASSSPRLTRSSYRLPRRAFFVRAVRNQLLEFVLSRRARRRCPEPLGSPLWVSGRQA